LNLRNRRTDVASWNETTRKFVNYDRVATIALVGKYVTLNDSYVSVSQALQHGAAANDIGIEILWIESEEFEPETKDFARLDAVDGIVLPQGYGKRGTEGKIAVANCARLRGIPLLGLCFGFQLSVVSFARHALGFEDANSTEIDPNTTNPVIDLLPEQRKVSELGGTMRLGGHDISILEPSAAYEIYGRTAIRGRHRHRFELNQSYLESFEKAGLHFSAFSDGGRRAEILELPNHPFYMGTQFHPEYTSRPERPEPIFVAFMKAAKERSSALRRENVRIPA
jgi:CTP synthase